MNILNNKKPVQNEQIDPMTMMMADPMLMGGMGVPFSNDMGSFGDLPLNDNINMQRFKGNIGSETFKQKTDTEKTLLDIELLLKSERIVIKTIKTDDGEIIQVPKREAIPNVKPLVNDIGVYKILNWLKVVFHKDSVQGNINLKQFNNLVGDFCTEFMQFLVVHRQEFDLKKDDLNTIHQGVYDALYMFLTRPVNNLERVINGGGQVVEHINQQSNSKDNGFLSQLWSGIKNK